MSPCRCASRWACKYAPSPERMTGPRPLRREAGAKSEEKPPPAQARNRGKTAEKSAPQSGRTGRDQPPPRREIGEKRKTPPAGANCLFRAGYKIKDPPKKRRPDLIRKRRPDRKEDPPFQQTETKGPSPGRSFFPSFPPPRLIWEAGGTQPGEIRTQIGRTAQRRERV